MPNVAQPFFFLSLAVSDYYAHRKELALSSQERLRLARIVLEICSHASAVIGITFSGSSVVINCAMRLLCSGLM